MGIVSRVRRLFRPKPKPTYQYSQPIGPTQPGKTISAPTPGQQYSAPIGPTKLSGGGSGGGSSGGGSSISPSSNQQSTMYSSQIPDSLNPNAPITTFGSGGLQSTTSSQIKAQQKSTIGTGTSAQQIKAYVQSEKAKDTLASLSKNKQNQEVIDSAFNKQSKIGEKDNTASNILINRIKQRAESQTQSMSAPDVYGIYQTQQSGGITPETAAFATGKSQQQVFKEKFESDYYKDIGNFKKVKEEELANLFASSQSRINAGEDYGQVSREYEQAVKYSNKELADYSGGYYSDWYNRRGKDIDKAQAKVKFDTDIIYSNEAMKKKLLGQFGIGAAVGAGGSLASAGIGAISTTGAAVIGGVGLVAGGGMGAYTLYKSGKAGVAGYSTAKQLGFTTKESLIRGTGVAGTAATPFAVGSAGALAGGLATIGSINYLKTGSIRGFTKTDIKNTEAILGRKNAINTKLIKGRTSDINVKEIGIGKSGPKLLGEGITGGKSIRQYKVGINTKGLTSSELSTVRKLNLRGTITQSITQQGKSVGGLELSQYKIGGVLGKTTKGVSFVQGQNKGGIIRGTKTSIFKNGRTQTYSLEAFSGKGNVRFAKDGLVRGEIGMGNSIKLAEYRLAGGKVTGGRVEQPQFMSSRQATVSNLIGKELTATDSYGTFKIAEDYKGVSKFEFGNIKTIKGTNIYQDTIGGSMSGVRQQIFRFPKVSGKITGGAISDGGSSSGGGLQLQTVQSTRYVPPTTSGARGIQLVKPATQFFSSPYAGTGRYETTGLQMDNRAFAKISSPISGLTLSQKTTVPTVSTARRGLPRMATIPTVTQFQVPSFNQSPRQQTQPLVKQQPLTKFNKPSPISPFPPTITPTQFTPGIAFALPFGSERPRMGFGNVGGKQTFKYTPSFKAIAFGIKGKATKQTKFSGLEFRPVVAGELFGGKKSKKKGQFPNFRL